MMQLVAIAIGGALGAVLRYSVSNGVYHLFGRGFPWGTLTVNILGSLLMGFLYILFVERNVVSLEVRSFVLIGLLGGFTTFSTFSLETLVLIETGEVIKAGFSILLSVVCCLTACWLGLLIARQL